MSQLEVAFHDISRPERPAKPRNRGISMMIDWGMGLALTEDVLQFSGFYIDKVKFAGMTATLVPKELLRKKIALYKQHDIDPSPGGLFAELTLKQGSFDRYLNDVRELGFPAVEISDNLLKISSADKAAAIRKAIEEYDLKVYGEVGRKEGKLTDDGVFEQIDVCLEAGCELVYLEAAEFFDGEKSRTELIDAIAKRFPMERLSFELPVVFNRGSSHAIKLKTASALVASMGTEVNLANIEHYEFALFESVRLGMGADTAHPDGAYRRAGFQHEEDD